MSIFEKFKHLFISKEEIKERDNKLAAKIEKTVVVDYLAKIDGSDLAAKYKKLVSDNLNNDQLKAIVDGDLVGDLTAIKGVGAKTADKILKVLK